MNFSISDIKEIVSTISVYDNMDYSGYSISFLKRRFSKVFETFNIRKMTHFYDLLKDDGMRDKVMGEMFVSSTEMFRDPSFWRYVRDNVLQHLPNLGDTVWMPDETGGEEAYSFSMMLHEQGYSDRMKIVCSNPSHTVCESIASGIVSHSQYELNCSNYKRMEDRDAFDSYFVKDSSVQTVSEELRSMILCKPLRYADAIAGEKVAMIAARNQALYYSYEYAGHYFQTLYETLLPGGYMAIGIKEKLPASIANKMTVVSEAEKIYRK